MSPRRHRFAQSYAEGYSATDAAILAGYSPDSAPSNAYRLLKDEQVVNAIAAFSGKRTETLTENYELILDSLSMILLDEAASVKDRLRASALMVQVLKLANKPRPRLPKPKAMDKYIAPPLSLESSPPSPLEGDRGLGGEGAAPIQESNQQPAKPTFTQSLKAALRNQNQAHKSHPHKKQTKNHPKNHHSPSKPMATATAA